MMQDKAENCIFAFRKGVNGTCWYIRENDYRMEVAYNR